MVICGGCPQVTGERGRRSAFSVAGVLNEFRLPGARAPKCSAALCAVSADMCHAAAARVLCGSRCGISSMCCRALSAAAMGLLELCGRMSWPLLHLFASLSCFANATVFLIAQHVFPNIS